MAFDFQKELDALVQADRRKSHLDSLEKSEIAYLAQHLGLPNKGRMYNDIKNDIISFLFEVESEYIPLQKELKNTQFHYISEKREAILTSARNTIVQIHDYNDDGEYKYQPNDDFDLRQHIIQLPANSVTESDETDIYISQKGLAWIQDKLRLAKGSFEAAFNNTTLEALLDTTNKEGLPTDTNYLLSPTQVNIALRRDPTPENIQQIHDILAQNYAAAHINQFFTMVESGGKKYDLREHIDIKETEADVFKIACKEALLPWLAAQLEVGEVVEKDRPVDPLSGISLYKFIVSFISRVPEDLTFTEFIDGLNDAQITNIAHILGIEHSSLSATKREIGRMVQAVDADQYHHNQLSTDMPASIAKYPEQLDYNLAFATPHRKFRFSEPYKQKLPPSKEHFLAPYQVNTLLHRTNSPENIKEISELLDITLFSGINQYSPEFLEAAGTGYDPREEIVYGHKETAFLPTFYVNPKLVTWIEEQLGYKPLVTEAEREKLLTYTEAMKSLHLDSSKENYIKYQLALIQLSEEDRIPLNDSSDSLKSDDAIRQMRSKGSLNWYIDAGVTDSVRKAMGYAPFLDENSAKEYISFGQAWKVLPGLSKTNMRLELKDYLLTLKEYYPDMIISNDGLRAAEAIKEFRTMGYEGYFMHKGAVPFLKEHFLDHDKAKSRQLTPSEIAKEVGMDISTRNGKAISAMAEELWLQQLYSKEEHAADNKEKTTSPARRLIRRNQQVYTVDPEYVTRYFSKDKIKAKADEMRVEAKAHDGEHADAYIKKAAKLRGTLEKPIKPSKDELATLSKEEQKVAKAAYRRELRNYKINEETVSFADQVLKEREQGDPQHRR